MRRAWRRLAAGSLLAIGLASLTAVPAAAKDTYPFFGPFQIRIVGANGDIRDFIALSAEDRRGASLLVEQVMSAIRGAAPPPPNESGAAGLPHYQIGVSHLGMTYDTTPWARLADPSFSYYPGGEGPTYLLVRFDRGDAAQERWLIPSPAVAAMIDQHARGLAPIGTEAVAAGGGPGTWEIVLGAALLAGLTLLLIEDRRRWRRGG
jgi:hypothetical protein